MSRLGRVVVICICLWVGTFLWCGLSNPQILLVDIIDKCWYEFVGAMAVGLIEDIRGK